ncbi:hypothetical protein B0H16DRAFT_1693102 [Mycena metata]|uniref:Novel STAND NTPase 1 domain-containing protein n=1 Tax=Mycena metata TaxID=1033252 RepID=A0AAD7IMT2_9AGAR|nr:hypothetical protein B0H16DRAFT_1693102 [Mycena metata]
MPRQPTITDIHLNNVSKCMDITMSSLQLLADTLKISGLEAILNTTQSLLKLAETIKQNRNSCNELMEQAHQVLIAIIGLYIKSDTGAELAPSVLNHIANFTQTLHKIHTFVEAQQSSSKVKTFFRQGEMSVLLRDCKAELRQGFDFFQISNIITEVKEMQEYAQARHQEVLDIIETLSNSDSASSISQVYSSSSYASSTSISMLPAEPKIFHGRESELAHILKLFKEEHLRIAILGAGGMGKTSLSKAVLHHPEITGKFHVNRFFIACDGLTNKVELVNIIGAHLGLKSGKDLTQGVLGHLANAPPTLLVLDNLETLWDPAETRKEIEEFLSLLTDITSLALMVCALPSLLVISLTRDQITMRGAERPSEVQWTRPFLLPLKPLAQDAAQKVFFDIADNVHLVEEVDQVLRLTDNMPLVINLLAHLVDTEGCSKILSRWEIERTSLLSAGYDKGSNLELSISLSLSSTRMTSMPNSHDLLGLLSILPDGLSDVELKQSNFPIKDIFGCKTALLRTALAYIDEHKRLRVLVPIREHIQTLLPATDQMIRPLFKHFQELLDLYNRHFGKASGRLFISQIASNFYNIQNILQNALHYGHPDLVAGIYCAHHLSRFTQINQKGDISLFHLISPILAQISDPQLEVYVITEIFRSWTFSRSHPNHPQELENRGKECCHYVNDPDLKCSFHLALAIYYSNRGQTSVAINHSQSALSLAQSTGNNEKQSDVLRHFAFIKWRTGDYTAGQAYAKEAHRLARITGHLYIEAIGLRAEALNWKELGNYTQCLLLANRARILLDMCGLAHSFEGNGLMMVLGEVRSHKSEYVEARSIHDQVAQVAVNDPYPLGASLINIADIEVSMGTAKLEIQRKINSAQTISKGIGIVQLSAVCDMVQASLNLREGDMSTSLFCKCLREMWGNDSEVVGQCLERLGDVSCWEGSHHDPSWSTVLFVHSLKQKKNLGIHKGLQFMGDIFLQEKDQVTASSLFTLALQGFTLMDVHRSRAECMIRLGDISEKNRDLLNALELWELARPLFERSSQTKQIQAIDQRMSRVDNEVKEQHQKSLARLVELSVPAGKVDAEDEEDSEIELGLDKAEVE